MNVELNIINNKLTKNESQACTDIMCTDILTGKMIDGYSMLHGSSMATSKKPVYKGLHRLLYVLEALYASITSIHIRPLEKVRLYMNLHSQYTYHPSLMGCINIIKSY